MGRAPAPGSGRHEIPEREPGGEFSLAACFLLRGDHGKVVAQCVKEISKNVEFI